MALANINGTLINNRIWIPQNDNGQKIAVISGDEDFRLFVNANLSTGCTYIQISNINDIRGKIFSGYVSLGVSNYYFIETVKANIIET